MCDSFRFTFNSSKSQNELCDQKIGQNAKNIITGGNKRSRGHGGIDAAFVENNGNESTYERGDHNHGDDGNAYTDGLKVTGLKPKMTDAEHNKGDRGAIDGRKPRFLEQPA